MGFRHVIAVTVVAAWAAAHLVIGAVLLWTALFVTYAWSGTDASNAQSMILTAAVWVAAAAFMVCGNAARRTGAVAAPVAAIAAGVALLLGRSYEVSTWVWLPLIGWPAGIWLVAAMSVAKVTGPGARAMVRFDTAIAEVEDAARHRGA